MKPNNTPAKVRITKTVPEDSHLSGLSHGSYFRFVEEDTNHRARWDPIFAYQLIGSEGKTAYCKVIDVNTGRARSVPKKARVISLSLISAEFEE